MNDVDDTPNGDEQIFLRVAAAVAAPGTDEQTPVEKAIAAAA